MGLKACTTSAPHKIFFKSKKKKKKVEQKSVKGTCESMKQRFTKHWSQTLALSPLNLPSEGPRALIRPPVYPLDLLTFWSPASIICSEIDRRIDALGSDSSGLGVASGSVGTVAAAILAVDGERAWARSPSGDWYGRFPPAGSRARSGVAGTLLSVPPLASHLCPGLRSSLRSGLRPGDCGPGLRACARAAPRVPGARRWGGTR